MVSNFHVLYILTVLIIKVSNVLEHVVLHFATMHVYILLKSLFPKNQI